MGDRMGVSVTSVDGAEVARVDESRLLWLVNEEMRQTNGLVNVRRRIRLANRLRKVSAVLKGLREEIASLRADEVKRFNQALDTTAAGIGLSEEETSLIDPDPETAAIWDSLDFLLGDLDIDSLQSESTILATMLHPTTQPKKAQKQ